MSSEYERYHNFSAGPAALPLSALKEAQRDLVCYPNAGASVLELSHRGKVIDGIIKEAEARLRRILNIPENYHVLFLQGGATTQFSMVPVNFLGEHGAVYIEQGNWSKKAIAEAKRVGKVDIAWTDKENGFIRVPADDEYEVRADADYFHITSNETIHGVEFHREPKTNGVPLVCDASSDFLGRPIDITKYGLVYAGAQKNIGPAGVTVVIISDEFFKAKFIEDEKRPIMLNYKVHIENRSLYNTCPVFSIYMVGLVLKWLEEEKGGIQGIYKENLEKADLLYKAIDESDGFYVGRAVKDSRSIMNVTWSTSSEELDKEFVKAAEARHMLGLKGHRVLGGLRASIYNATSLESVQALVDFMKEFKAQH